jgi:hypothetical protein
LTKVIYLYFVLTCIFTHTFYFSSATISHIACGHYQYLLYFCCWLPIIRISQLIIFMPMLFYLITSICFAILLKRFSIAIDISSYYPLIYFELHDSIYLTVRLIYLFATFLPYFPVLVFTYFLKFALFYIMYFFAFFIFTNYELVAYFASIINGLLQLPLFDKNIITYTSLIFIATTLLNFIYSIQLTSVILYCAFHFLLIYFRILVF